MPSQEQKDDYAESLAELEKSNLAFAAMVKRNHEQNEETIVHKKTTEEKLESATTVIRDLKIKLDRQNKDAAAATQQVIRYEAERARYSKEREKAHRKSRWLYTNTGHARDRVRQFIEAHYNLYGEYPKVVPVPSELYRELYGVEWFEFAFLSTPEPYAMYTDPLKWEPPSISRVRICIVGVD